MSVFEGISSILMLCFYVVVFVLYFVSSTTTDTFLLDFNGANVFKICRFVPKSIIIMSFFERKYA